jgi:hypothetical protein
MAAEIKGLGPLIIDSNTSLESLTQCPDTSPFHLLQDQYIVSLKQKKNLLKEALSDKDHQSNREWLQRLRGCDLHYRLKYIFGKPVSMP